MLRVLLAAPRNRQYYLNDGKMWDVDPPKDMMPDEDAFRRAVYAMNGGSRLFPSLPNRAGGITFRAALANAVRHVYFPAESSADPLPAGAAIDSGLKLLRRLDELVTLGEGLSLHGDQVPEESTPPPLPISLRTCHLDTLAPSTGSCPAEVAPTPGSLVARHPLLRRDVVLLLSVVGDGWDSYCMGVVINDPTDARVGASSALVGRSRGQTIGRDGWRERQQHDPPRIGELLRAAAKGEAASPAFRRQPLVSEVGQNAARSPPHKAEDGNRAAGATGAPTSTEPPRDQWTTGGRRLTDELASQRHTRDLDLAFFADHVVHNGGPEGGSNVTMLHPHGDDVRGCVPIPNTPLYYGGDLGDAAELVRSGRASPGDFSFFRGRVDWRPGELRGEVELGEWRVGTALAAAPTPPPPPENAATILDVVRQMTPTEPLPSHRSEGSRRRRRHRLWAQVVEAIAHAEDELEQGQAGQLRSWLKLTNFGPQERGRLLPE
jgi:hypothetical protein